MPSAIGNGARDRAGGIAHLLAEGGDAGVAGEREEQQSGGLQHAADGDVVTDVSRAASTSPKPRITTTTAASTASTTATMTRVSSADFWMPA